MSDDPPRHGVNAVAPARLLGLRLQGFKSFAERTVVEFGPGISAIVGPNGSGKSNLADALRWALGEQGKALRSRKSEDVIFAGSERRAALGMADVTLVLDNADALLPVEYDVLEIGRRLYRSGENDYLLNRQRIRLRDLVELLDAAHLADNAFLFIGQGMVDQALALRPEERRPLFEEVAGVRRHERRRRRAEEQLAEAEANLARTGDILAEIRPQARRLAAQAEQQASRATAGEELAAALMLGAHARWHEAAAHAAAGAARLATTRSAVDAALAGLHAEEAAATAIAAALGARADREAQRRVTHDAALGLLTALRLREARLAGDLEAIGRDRRRLEEERSVAAADRAARRRELAEPVPGRDHELEDRVAQAERALREGLEELGALRATNAARGGELVSLRRAEAARGAELDAAARRLADVERRLAEEAVRARVAAERHADLERRVAEARAESAAATAAEATARDAREAARLADDEAEGRRRVVAEAGIAAGGRLAGLRGRLDALVSRLAEEESRGIARAARRRGGRRLDEDLRVEPAFRAAVEAALGESLRAYLVAPGAVDELASERGVLVVERDARPVGPIAPEALREAVQRSGGTMLGDAVRSDASGAVRRLLETAVCVPDLATAMALQPSMPVGWVAVIRDGSGVVARHTVALGRADALLERRAEIERLSGQIEEAVVGANRAAAALAAVESDAGDARAALERARTSEAGANAERRGADESERAAGREAEAAARESAWLAAQVARLEGEAARQRQLGEALRDAEAAAASARAGIDARAAEAGSTEPGAIAAWERRVGELREQRDRLVTVLDEEDRRRRETEARHARAEAAVALDDDRIERAERDLSKLGEDERALGAAREGLRRDLAATTADEEGARLALDETRTADAADRARLAAAEAAASAARDRLRSADERLRSSEVGDLEARLGLDAIREQLLVELAGLGELGLRALGVDGAGDDETAALEAALAARAPGWAASTPEAAPVAPGRLAYLRRRYHELGAANPFAVEEYAGLKARLESLEAQDADLRAAIGGTRSLIEELNALIADQFRATFRALETAFDARFRQLFGGGFARLSLTDPADLGATGVEIVARPPGKKAQALAMLSGGERALTAVALLFAMLEVRPVPFCVLDEVDAALDEANVGRFSEALRGLAGRTQFIVITHNRGTIEVADALYGVTVGDDTVSRVVSLRLEEAQALAGRGGEARDLRVG